MEEQLIGKKFYETMIDDINKHPIQALGEMFLVEQKKERSDLTTIRFAQGEVYFLHHDFEAAIFKWENIEGNLAEWAKKNIADAYFELEMYSTAEDIYKAINTSEPVLKTEVLLQLFSLYIVETRNDLASKVVKEAVDFQPDYPNVTEIARSFFEAQKDWNSAIVLAANESIRTESMAWFDVLKTYIQQGVAQSTAPDYFANVLRSLYNLDQDRFEKMTVALWKNYKYTDSYFEWLKVINKLIDEIELNNGDVWDELSVYYRDAYAGLLEGTHLVKELSPVVPRLLENWLKIAEGEISLFAAASVLSWNEIFPDTVSALVVQDAESLLAKSPRLGGGLEAGEKLIHSIIQWAESNDLLVGNKLKWMVEGIKDMSNFNLLLVGSAGNGKTSFIQSIAGESIAAEDHSSLVSVKDGDDLEIYEITDTDRKMVEELTELDETRRQRGTIVDVTLISDYLRNNRLRLLDTPGFNGEKSVDPDFQNYLLESDGVMFVLDARAPFTGSERDLLLEMQQMAPKLPIHFLLNKMDTIYSDQVAVRMEDETWDKVNAYFPNAKVFAFSKLYDSKQQLQDLAVFLHANYQDSNWKEMRAEKLLAFTRKTLSYLLEKRAANERKCEHSISWNEQMEVKLNGATNQLTDLEKEKTENITRSYRLLKEEVKKQLSTRIPELLRDCSKTLSENSDFSQVHIQLNQEMNDRIQAFISDKIMPQYFRSLQDWIATSELEFTQSQQFMDEMSAGFNELYKEERIVLAGDFRVLDDWRRDADRMTSSIRIENVNILLRRTPSQLILKGAGKLFGAIPQNKANMYNRYKKFLENEDFQDVADMISDRFLTQFGLFEKSLERDISLFYRSPFSILEKNIEQTKAEIKEQQATLEHMRQNPEVYRDPITLFEVKLRQFERLEKIEKRRLAKLQGK
ncbi:MULTISPECIES: GTP-binding protein [unclassified Peribacillus]|uniref:GTP-binding protein n=1 Tax=unclassified Peribacillus TaxID=2675266 RepID=UPI003804FAC2